MLKTDAETIRTNTGRYMPITTCLVKDYTTPSGGWSVDFIVNGISIRITGNRPIEVITSLRQHLMLNNVEFDEKTLWLNCNLQWLERSLPQNRLVSVHDLSYVSFQVAPKEVKEAPKVAAVVVAPRYTPADWGSVAWKWLGLYLAQDVFSITGFKNELVTVLQMLNPTTNPSIGCVECFEHFTKIVEDSEEEIADQQSARVWLVNAHNKVNATLEKPLVTFEQAATQNFWV